MVQVINETQNNKKKENKNKRVARVQQKICNIIRFVSIRFVGRFNHSRLNHSQPTWDPMSNWAAKNNNNKYRLLVLTAICLFAWGGANANNKKMKTSKTLMRIAKCLHQCLVTGNERNWGKIGWKTSFKFNNWRF